MTPSLRYPLNPKENMRFFNRVVIIATATLLSVITPTIFKWNRIAYHTVSRQTFEEGMSALIIFLTTLGFSYGIPVIICRLIKLDTDDQGWSILEIATIVLGLIVGFGLIEGLGTDIIIQIVYLTAFLSYSFAAQKALSNWRAKLWSRFQVNAAVMLVAGVGILVVSFVIGFVE